MSDDSDKTVFKQPVPGMDRTVMKPSPGRRAGAPARPKSPAATRAMPAVNPGMDTEAAYFRNEYGLNPLVNAASTLLAVFATTRQAMSHSDVGGLHQRLINELKEFDNRLRQLEYKNEVVLSARYAMCVILDEAVLNTPWGANSGWGQRTLLTVFHNESSGGEKFFQLLDRMRQSPSENMDMIELFYVCLSLGYEGKYRIANRGRDQLEGIRDDLFKIIRNYRGEYDRELADSWQGLGAARRTLTDFIPMWVLGVIALTIVFFSYSGFRYWLYDTATPVADRLYEISYDVEAEADESEEKVTQ